MSKYESMVVEIAPGFHVYKDEDEFPVLVCGDSNEIPLHIWQQAYDEHAVVLLVQYESGHAISAQEFIEEREDVPSLRAYRVTRWRTDVSTPSVRDYYGAGAQVSAEGSVDDLGTFVHLHTHSEYSALDGLSTVSEIMAVVDSQGGKAVGSCDHGNCAIHPEQQAVADKYGIKPIFGMEGYFVPDRHRRGRKWIEFDGVEVDPKVLNDAERKKAVEVSDSQEALNEYTHLSLWAMTQAGLRNLWAMSTEGFREGFYKYPRIDWDTLERLGEGVILGTGCLRGPVSQALIRCGGCGHEYSEHSGACTHVDKAKDDTEIPCLCQAYVEQDDLARDTLMKMHAIFGDRLYVEIHANTLLNQKKANEGLIALARTYGIPLVMAVDAHYAIPEQKGIHDVWVKMSTGKVMGEDTSMFQGNQDYHLLTEDEIRDHCSYLPDDAVKEAMDNTVEIARRCTAEVRGAIVTPTYSKATKDHPDPVARDIERMMDICIENFERRTRGKSYSAEEAMARLEREAKLIIAKQFPGYFLIVWDYVTWAKREGCLVGPSRGSGGGSFIAYLMEITETDPIENDLIFERFLTEGRTELPDFDIDFPTSWRTKITKYIRQRWGEDYTSSIGTLSRLRAKAAINDVHRVLEPLLREPIPFAEMKALKSLIDEANAGLAGKQLPWDDFVVQFADAIEPLRQRWPEVFLVVENVVDRLKTYGKHAAGVVISTDHPLTDLPMYLTTVEERIDGKKVETQMMVTQFDMNALAILGYVKFDILTLRTLDTLQETVDLIAEKFGKRINVYDWLEEYNDPEVWEQVAAGHTLGLFQIETATGHQMIRRMQPGSLEDLAAVVTIVRPGPYNSGLTDSYLRRRKGIEPVSYPDPRMEEFVGNTYGAMIYQEQVMAACMILAGYDSNEADSVRSILGKKKVEKIPAAGEEFLRRAVENHTDPAIAKMLWDQMAEFAKYGFNRAHAFAYAVLGYWTAWFKFHFPVEFLMACMSTVDADRVPEFIDECRVMGYKIRPPDINDSAVPFTSDGLEVVWGLLMVKGIGIPAAEHIVKHQPYTSLEDFLERAVETEGSPVNMGHVKTLVAVGAFDSIVENRRAVEMTLEREANGEAKKCTFKVALPQPTHPHNLPCSYDWANEPDPPLIPRGRGKAKIMVVKEPQKACNVKCRQYLKPPPLDQGDVEPYSEAEIMEREREMLGVWVTYSPWDRAEQKYLDASVTATQIENGPTSESRAAHDPNDYFYVGVALVEGVKGRKERVSQKDYAFVTLNMQDGRVEPVCFSSVYAEIRRNLEVDTLGVASIIKTTKGLQLASFVPYPSSTEA